MVEGWLDEAIEINCMHKSMSRAGYRATHIVQHGTAGGSSAENIANYFKTSDVQASTHFVIGKDGHIVQCISCDAAAFGNGVLNSPRLPFPANVNPNLYTISIEHVKQATDNSDVITPAQAQASFRLTQILCQTYDIPAREGDAQGGIISHADLDSINRSRCPGPYPWDQLWAFLKGEKKMLDLNDPIVRRYFSDAGNGRWRCKNGVILFGAILTFYRTYGGPALLGLPLTDEDYSQPDAAFILCERAIIMYDPKRRYDNPPVEGSCYLIHLNGELSKQLLIQRSDEELQALNNKLKQIHEISAV